MSSKDSREVTVVDSGNIKLSEVEKVKHLEVTMSDRRMG